MVIPVSPPLTPNTLLDKAYTDRLTDKRTDGQMDMDDSSIPTPTTKFMGEGIRINKILDNKQNTHTQKKI